MSSSLFTKPSPPVTTSRQLPQHPKMCLSYILNPAPQTQTTVAKSVVPEQALLPEDSISEFPSSPCLSDVGIVVTPLCVPDLSADLVGSFLSHNPTPPSPTTSDQQLAGKSQSCSYSPSVFGPGDIKSPSSFLVPDPSFDLLHDSLSSDPYNPPKYHDCGSALDTPSSMNRGGIGLPNLAVGSAILDSSCPLSPHLRDLNTLPDSSPMHQEFHSTNEKPSSSTVISQPLLQHPKMALSYILNPNPMVDKYEETKLEPADPKPVPPRMSRSPSPSLSESEVSSPVTSDFNFHGSPVLSQYPRSDTPPPNESQLSSPATTPPSSPRPIPHTIPDLPQMVQPPQHLPWEGAPPPGMNPRDHRAYQRAGVHWMLAEIFSPDIG
ncbi:hypothetical protein Clacol_000969 [Clathrus columnatus]|uniref:Uncharacterized protein n=1 Tax=Clathrus columnatus TaxID=1419009 RepID=A0AAV5A0P1_9AGAM|nr:hypothetical protein Clacol_000969 [Clathrus columnatus]